MRRLEHHRKKQLSLTLFTAILVLIALVFFISTIGLKIVLNSAVFVAQITNKNQKETTVNKDADFYGLIDVASIPSATNSAKIYISGSVANFDRIEVYVNGKKVQELKPTDRFDEQIGDLKPGNNEVYLVAKSSKSSQKKETNKYSILYMNEKPKLEITEPSDNSKTSKNEIKVSGKTDKEVMIKINNLPVVVDALGVFQSAVSLKEGENKIEITAEDLAGNTDNKILTVTYQKED
ncbi:hypothetical protein GYA28_00090 [Candidatus Roizmanbacteria bacterium]|jgi:hypothetical protein|nr:hypothetical protein [Candidatus Roizmanbacteria bacterium]